jgi:hypothetical protein
MKYIKITAWMLAAVVALVGISAYAQESPANMAATYSGIADAILALRQTEADFVRSLLSAHRRAAEQYYRAGDFEMAAVEMVLFANEGDNAIGGVRKRLVEGGHHHNAEAERRGMYDTGFVVVTREAKQEIMAAATTVRQTSSADERDAAWGRFQARADGLLGSG